MLDHINALHNLRRWIILIWIMIMAIGLNSCSPAKPHVYRVGILSGLDIFATVTDGFKTQMAEVGYIEGQNIEYDVQQTDVHIEAYHRVLQQFIADQVDLIFVFPTEASIEAKFLTQGSTIPLIFAHASVEDTDLIQSMSEPGNNITGVRYPGPEIVLKRFEILQELIPDMKRLLVPYQRNYPSVPSQLAALRPAAVEAGITLIEAPSANAAELQGHLVAGATPDDPGIDAVVFLSEPLSGNPAAMAVIAQFASRYQIPMGGTLRTLEEYRPLFSVDVDTFTTGRQAALLADKIFSGTPAGKVPATSSEIVFQIDYTMAQRMGIAMPNGLLRQADQVLR